MKNNDLKVGIISHDQYKYLKKNSSRLTILAFIDLESTYFKYLGKISLYIMIYTYTV